MTIDGDCSYCDHPWSLHPVALLEVSVCAGCIHDEDHGLRDDLCELAPPGLAHLPASQFLVPRLERSRLGRRRVELVDRDGQPQYWGIRHLGWSTQAAADTALADMAAALDRLPVLDFRRWVHDPH